MEMRGGEDVQKSRVHSSVKKRFAGFLDMPGNIWKNGEKDVQEVICANVE